MSGARQPVATARFPKATRIASRIHYKRRHDTLSRWGDGLARVGSGLVLATFVMLPIDKVVPIPELAFIMTFVAGLLFLAAALTLYTIGAKVRRTIWWRHAVARGWQYIPQDTYDRPARFRSIHPFSVGGAAVYDVMVGQLRGTEFEVFTCTWPKTPSVRVAAVHMPVAAPQLTVEPETAGKKAKQSLGRNDIDFESDEFSRRFWVECENRVFAHKAITPKLMEFLLQQPAGCTWRWNGEWLLLICPGWLELEQIEGMAESVVGFRERVPRLLYVEQRAWQPVPISATGRV